MSSAAQQAEEARREVLHNHGYAAHDAGWRPGEEGEPPRQPPVTGTFESGTYRTVALYLRRSHLANLRQPCSAAPPGGAGGSSVG